MAVVLAVRRAALGSQGFCKCGHGKVLVARRSFSPMAWYNAKLQKAPVLTKSITSGVLFGLGDVIAQFVVKKEGEKFDFPRLGRAWVFGTFILGPLGHLHYNFIEWLTAHKLQLVGMRMILSKVFLDQFAYWAPVINAIYLFSLPMMAGKGSTESSQIVRERLLPVLKVNWMIWPAAQMINFRFIPVVHQLNFVLIVSLGWATFLSLFNAKRDSQKKE